MSRHYALEEVAPDFLMFAENAREVAEKRISEFFKKKVTTDALFEIYWMVWNRGPQGEWEWELEKPEWVSKIQFPRYRVMAVEK